MDYPGWAANCPPRPVQLSPPARLAHTPPAVPGRPAALRTAGLSLLADGAPLGFAVSTSGAVSLGGDLQLFTRPGLVDRRDRLRSLKTETDRQTENRQTDRQTDRDRDRDRDRDSSFVVPRHSLCYRAQLDHCSSVILLPFGHWIVRPLALLGLYATPIHGRAGSSPRRSRARSWLGASLDPEPDGVGASC